MDHQQLTEGADAPGFDLPAHGGGRASLAALRGRKVALVFYPKADTSGCTRELLDFTALKPRFEEAGTAIIAISVDPLRALEKFKAKHGLGLVLASDADKSAVADYGVWGEKSMYGRKYMGTERTTFLIGGDGRIARIWPKVKVPGHAEDVLAAAQAL